MIYLGTRSILFKSGKVWLVLVLLAVLAGAGALITLTRMAHGTAEPGGVITYTTPNGDVRVRPNGEKLVGAGSAPPAVASVQGTSAEDIPAPDAQATAVVERAADGTWLSVRDQAGQRRLAQLASPGSPPVVNGVKTVARSLGGIPLVVSWSPDGAYLAYGTVSGLPYSLSIADRTTWSPRSYEVGNDYVGEAAWSPDGRYLAISTYSLDRKNHTVYVWDGDSKALSKLVDGCHIAWSPDGRYLVLHRDPYREPGVWIVSVDGKERRALTHDSNGFPLSWRSA